METATGGQLVAESLARREIPYVFTLSGGHISSVYQHLEGGPVRLFDTRHEQAAVFMAEAWAKMTRTPSVAMVTAGPGFTNALTGVASASFSNSPVLILAGAVGLDSREKLDLQDMPQAPVIAPMVKKALVCHRAERIPEIMDLAFRTAQGGRPGPVYVELPVDVLDQEVKRPLPMPAAPKKASGPVDLAGVKETLKMIRNSQKPVIIAGTGVWQSGAEAVLKAWVEETGMPVLTILSGRGTVPDTHPLCFEGALGIRPGAAFFAYAETDLVLVLGNRISLYYLFGKVFRTDAKMVQVDIHAEEMGRNRPVDLPVQSDCKAFLQSALAAVRDEGAGPGLRERFGPWIEALQKAHQEGKRMSESDWQSDKVPIHPLRLAREIDDFMDRKDDVVVADGGDTATWMGMTRTVRAPGRYLDYGIFGSLAVGIPYANAAKLCYPDSRVLLITGDGSVGFNFMEFETSVRKGLPIVVVISNDLGWGMIRHSQELRMGHAVETGTYLGRVEYHRLVEALGGKGILVERPEAIRPALEEAFSSGKTACINVMTDPTVVSPASIALANLGAYR